MIEVLGLTTTTMEEDCIQYIQYTILTKTGNRYYDYIFTPNARGKYTLQTKPTIDRTIEMKQLSEMTLTWQGNKLLLHMSGKTVELYDSVSRVFFQPSALFEPETALLPKRTVLIIDGNPDEVLPFITNDKTIAYTDEWVHLPQNIPEDIIVMNAKKFPIADIAVRLPQRTKAAVITTRVLN
jgi:hypothetical protein